MDKSICTFGESPSHQRRVPVGRKGRIETRSPYKAITVQIGNESHGAPWIFLLTAPSIMRLYTLNYEKNIGTSKGGEDAVQGEV